MTPDELSDLRTAIVTALAEEKRRATSPTAVLASPDGFREGVRAAEEAVLRVLAEASKATPTGGI